MSKFFNAVLAGKFAGNNGETEYLAEKFYEAFGDTRNMNENLIDFSKLDHSVRLSPSSGAIVSSNGTKYSLLVLELVPNSTYTINQATAGYGLFNEYPTLNRVASFYQTSSAPFTFESENYKYLALNVAMVETNTATTTENTPTAQSLNNYVMRTDVKQNVFVTEQQMFEESDESYNMINPANIDYNIRHSTGTVNLVASSLTIASSGFIEVEEGETYAVSGCLYSKQGGYYAEGTEHLLQQKGVANITFETDDTGAGFKFTVPTGQNIKYACLSLRTNADRTALSDIIQMERGSAVTEYRAYERKKIIKKNLLPNTDNNENSNGEYLKESDLMEYHSFNLLNPENFKFDRRYSTGSLAIQAESSLKIASSGLVEVEEGEWYTVSGAGIYSGYQGGFFGAGATDAIGAKAIANITFTTPVTGAGKCFQVPIGQGVKYALISLATNTDRTALAGNAQMEVGEMATDYVEYELRPLIKEELLPSSIGNGGSGGTSDSEELKKYTTLGNLHYSGIDEKIPNFKKHWYAKDKDLCVVNTGTSLTARSIEHCTAHKDAAVRPPLMHSNNFASLIWDALKWEGQQYRRYDSGFFTETGTFATANNLEEWDDGAYRSGLTRYIDGAGSVAYTLPADAWQANFIYRSDSAGSEACTVTVAEGDGVMVVKNDAGEWVEANGYVFSQREPDVTVIDSFEYTVPTSGSKSTVTNYQVKGNTTYQKRLYMKAVDRTAEKHITISNAADRLLYWGVEWSPREFMITYINAARGSHSSAVSTNSTALNHYQDNEIWTFNPDLLLTEDPIHNAGGATKPSTACSSAHYGQVTENFFFADNEVSLTARATTLGKTVPEMVIFNTTITYNFGGFDEETGELFFTQLKDGVVWSALDAQMSCYAWVKEKHPEVVYINAVKNFHEACIKCYGDLATATIGSGKDGSTFTNEGSHWNDTGSKVMARVVLPVLDMDI